MNETTAPTLSPQPRVAVFVEAHGATARQPLDTLIERLQTDLLDQGVDPDFVRAEMLLLRRDTHDGLAAPSAPAEAQ